jgi:hypothetical protein
MRGYIYLFESIKTKGNADFTPVERTIQSLQADMKNFMWFANDRRSVIQNQTEQFQYLWNISELQNAGANILFLTANVSARTFT